ncbi:hypothetical protein F3087_23000 [Nocardia colli]|uniref:Outer membrane channel protein CpnT-like N-terminal domain-containing protein n=1 Tax=Nocardia colli TaxID=2545717 RepID=A0A5N0EEX4_9NOCA|nr:hypothetical protein [Nocardia colli]KAA8886645.1 hypothetical protein F3087_23000 [Nocardia colli]
MSKLEVDPKVYYQAAVNCFDAAAALNDSFKYVFGELNSCGQMAGRDEDGRAWAASYDESARDAVSFFDQTFSTLRAYGTALNDVGFEHAKSDAALKGTAQPDRPADSASTATFGPYALPASAAGGTPQGLAKTSIEVLDAINCPLPDGNTDTLTKAADAWDRLGTIYQNTNAKDKITIAAGLFDDVTSKDAVQVREDLKTLETSIGQLLTTCTQISKTCLDYKESIVELRNEIKGFIEAIIEEAAINVAVIVIASCLTGVGGLIAGAKAAESAHKWAGKIKASVSAWRARKVLQLRGLADDARTALAKGRQAVEDLYERIRKAVGSLNPFNRKKFEDLFQGRTPKASEIEDFAKNQGWTRSQTENGPLKYTDENGIVRITIKKGSDRAPGSGDPHVEIRDSTGQRTDPYGNPVTRKSPDNHTSIDWDLP